MHRIFRRLLQSHTARMWARVLLALGTLAAAGGAAFVYLGLYDVAATEQHTTPVYWLIQAAMRRSVAVRSSAHPLPDLSSPGLASTGLRVYDAQCARCHGAPGVAPDAFALGMTPVAENLAETARTWPANDVYRVVKHGIKMTGMPHGSTA